MGKNNHSKRRETRTGMNAGAMLPNYTGDHRKTLSDGLRILARIIARAHLGRQAERSCAPAPGPAAGG